MYATAAAAVSPSMASGGCSPRAWSSLGSTPREQRSSQVTWPRSRRAAEARAGLLKQLVVERFLPLRRATSRHVLPRLGPLPQLIGQLGVAHLPNCVCVVLGLRHVDLLEG